ncbi:MAG: transcription-repair coupling factor [Anaerolineales bacterium]|jgi:transcription-repair coupling factor (superfamily II helicase)|uniref:transcription-repair coupling factor n=1 Tax=Candidatus Villigracilis vicinus TaxID=3140679 RepID=UPI003135F202|nr:transcription-repair coupling factor [Anaerolineales bacterium]MBK9780706.1 transcription-repair coupling factor [Anaerolineales bacterium]
MQPLLQLLRTLSPYQRLLSELNARKPVSGLGLPRSARLPILAALHADVNQPILFITDRADHALAMYDELGFWVKSPRYLFAEPNPLFYEEAAWGVTTRRDRLQVLTALSAYHLPFAKKPEVPPIIVASVRSLMTRTLPRRDFLKACKKLTVNQSSQPDGLMREWARIGYQRVNTVLEPGQFSGRGGILDVWAPTELNPVRLDFFGDEIETIRSFDPATQRTLEKLESILLTPSREFLADTTESETTLSEFHIPLLHGQPASLMDYLPQKTLVLVDDLSLIDVMANEVEEQAVKFRQESIKEGTLAENFPVPYVPWSELNDNLSEFVNLELGHSTEAEEGVPLASHFGHDERFGGRLKPFIDYLAPIVDNGGQVFIISRQAQRLRELWFEHYPDSEHTNLEFIEASLSEGFTLKTESLDTVRLITDSEVFGWERPQPRTRQRQTADTPEALYADLQTGDYVVHVDHGIGRFAGLIQRQLDGHEREYLTVEYERGDILYVPVHQADRLTRYVGADGGKPSLDNLGGQVWAETKAKVKEAVQKVAEDLLDLYARRQVVAGYSFSGDTQWQKELEDSFPYVETEDQKRAITDIKRDMERARPMDRLLCGDVGYGKTEVALRAAFKAVMGGKQVAVLVPTTVLAQQHFETFSQRLAAFPVKVEMLSRFRTPREQTEILHQLSIGEVDIIIGTHRLISSDVVFKDLGLVVIDEEQRFGVTHKEHLKKLRTEVDVLTLTATPIPRTLYMALTGVRDISNLNTPPEERLPIITHVGPYSPRLVRQAILRELERGGQIFFVHNRVQTIDAMKAHLEKLVPEARIDIGHGQMHESQLSAVMRRFTNAEIDILLSTTIIESGLDIPNANTLIVDRADTFGLAQLYQLRGRVGRGAMRAYAYFFRHNKMSPTQEGQQRLEVIAENTQLGAGYSIAMRDLEIRGAGELLGTRQHGFIQSVGFHLYTRMLADAVRRMRRIASDVLKVETDKFDNAFSTFNLPLSIPVNVDLPLAVGIPANYIPDQDLRLRLYRRIADLRDETELDALGSEFRDRFGQLPEMVQNLFYQIRVKLRAEEVGLTAVGWEAGQILLKYPAPAEGAEPKRLPDLPNGVRGGKGQYWVTVTKEEVWTAKLLDVLARLGDVS